MLYTRLLPRDAFDSLRRHLLQAFAAAGLTVVDEAGLGTKFGSQKTTETHKNCNVVLYTCIYIHRGEREYAVYGVW